MYAYGQLMLMYGKKKHHNTVMVSAIYQHKSAIGIHFNLPPSFTPLPPLSPPCSSRLSQSTSFACLASYIKLPLAICFTYGRVYVSMLVYQLLPRSPSPTESKSLFFMSVSPLLPRTQDCWYHLLRFHMYALIYDICLSLSDLLHSVSQALGRFWPAPGENVIHFSLSP